MWQILVALSIPSAITAFCFGLIEKRLSKQDKERQEKEKAHEQMETLIIQSTGASIALGEACAIALKNGKCNGETEAALEYAREIKHKQKDFLTEQGIKALH